MLYLTRKPGETIVINETIEMTVVSVSGKSVKLGFNFPPEVTILRKEVLERIQLENKAAAGAAEIAPTLLDLSQITVTPAPLPPKTDNTENSEDES